MNQNEVYVGARYVPVFADPVEWSSDRDYEPLTIVTHNYDTYTSRQYVPEGIEIDNPLFWVKSGNTGGVIGDFTEQIEALQTNVGNNTSAIGTLQTDVTALSDAIAAISSTYSTVQAMLDDYNAMSAADLAEKVGEVVRTACFVDMTNGGGAFYQLVNDATLTANNMDVFGLNTAGYFVKLVPDAVVSLEQFGIVRGAVSGYAGVATHTAIAYVINNYAQVVGNGEYSVNGQIVLETSTQINATINTISGNVNNYILDIRKLTNSYLKASVINSGSNNCINIRSSYNKMITGNTLLFTIYENAVFNYDANINFMYGNSVHIYGRNYTANIGGRDTFYLTASKYINVKNGYSNIRLINNFNTTIDVSSISSVLIECISGYLPDTKIVFNSSTNNVLIKGTITTSDNNKILGTGVYINQNKYKHLHDKPIIYNAQTSTDQIGIGNYGTYIKSDIQTTITLNPVCYDFESTNCIYIDNTNQNITIQYKNTTVFNGASSNSSIYKLELINDTMYSINQINTAII